MSVVVTGLGVVGGFGAGEDALRAVLASGAPVTASIEDAGLALDGHSPRSQRASVVPKDALRPWLAPGKARRMSPASRLAVAGSVQAIEAAGLASEDVAGPETAVSLGTYFGSTSYTYKLLAQLRETGALSVSPLLFMETVANAHAGQIALMLGLEGPNYTISQREASGALAVARGVDLVRSGRAQRVIAGAADEASPIQHVVLDAYGALARPGAEGVQAARAFGREPTGVLLSEGAALWVLEDEAAARGRGANVRARVLALVRANDATATQTDWGDGAEHLGASLRARLEALDTPLDSIDRIVAGAAGARRGDALELRTLQAAFGDTPLPPIAAPKAATGAYGGGELGAALLALEGADWAPGLWFRAGSDGWAEPVQEAPRGPAERVLVSAVAAGGAACWIVLERADD